METLAIGVVTCWYREKSCARYSHNLVKALEDVGVHCRIVSANCLCYRDNPFREELFFSPCDKVQFSDLYWKPGPKTIQYLRAMGELFTDSLKGARYLGKLSDYPLFHYQQVGGSYGFLPLLSFLSIPTDSKRVVTVHEIDKNQKSLTVKSKKLPMTFANRVYNRADAIIVMTYAMKEVLISMGVNESKLHVIPHGVAIPPVKPKHRNLIMFCGGHHLTTGKGFDKFLNALLILKEQGYTPRVAIHGLNPEYGQEKGLQWVEEARIGPQVEWLDYGDDEAITAKFQEAMFMVIPYITSEVGAAVTRAMANGVPVIGTRRMGLPEYLGKDGLYLDEENPKSLAHLMRKLLDQKDLREKLGNKLSRRASEKYDWAVIAKQTAKLYRRVIGGRC